MKHKTNFKGSIEIKPNNSNQWIGFIYIANGKLDTDMYETILCETTKIAPESTTPMTQYWNGVNSSSTRNISFHSLIDLYDGIFQKSWSESDPQNMEEILSICEYIKDKINADVQMVFFV